MVKLKIEVDDWDTSETIALTLPCDVKSKVDTTHELQIIDWDGTFSLGYYDDIVKLNDAIEEINAENPTMTLEMLIEILEASGAGSLDDKDFIRKVCSSDFMLEEITDTENWLMNSEEEKCACYLATEMMIPFARNITEKRLEEIKDNMIDVIDWKTVWRYYTHMGFKLLQFNDAMYAFHWGDAVE